MKTRLRPRYYCDFCGKSGGSKYHMANHEDACTANPDRHCNMCDFVEGGYIDDNFFDLVCVLHQGPKLGDDFFPSFCGYPSSFSESIKEKLSNIVNDCPACLFAALRQTETLYDWNETSWKERFDERYNDRLGEIHEENQSIVGYVG